MIGNLLEDQVFDLLPGLLVLLSDGSPHLKLELEVIRLLAHLEILNAVGLRVWDEPAHGFGLEAELVQDLLKDWFIVGDLQFHGYVFPIEDLSILKNTSISEISPMSFLLYMDFMVWVGKDLHIAPKHFPSSPACGSPPACGSSLRRASRWRCRLCWRLFACLSSHGRME